MSVRSFDPVHSSLSFQQFDQIIFDDDQNGSNIEEKTKRRRSIELNRIELNCLKMNFVRVSGRIGLTSLCLSLICSFISLIFYLISFCLSDWIFYQTIPIKIGLWKLCDVQIFGYDRCSDWNDRSYPTNITDNVFSGPPDFIRTSQSLEIVAFVFLILSILFLLFGLCQRSMAILFFASAISMFVTVVFHSSTIGLFVGQGKSSSYLPSLGLAWWLAIVSLLFAILSSISLFVLSFYIRPNDFSLTSNEFYPNLSQQKNISIPLEYPIVYPSTSSNLYSTEQFHRDQF